MSALRLKTPLIDLVLRFLGLSCWTPQGSRWPLAVSTRSRRLVTLRTLPCGSPPAKSGFPAIWGPPLRCPRSPNGYPNRWKPATGISSWRCAHPRHPGTETQPGTDPAAAVHRRAQLRGLPGRPQRVESGVPVGAREGDRERIVEVTDKARAEHCPALFVGLQPGNRAAELTATTASSRAMSQSTSSAVTTPLLWPSVARRRSDRAGTRPSSPTRRVNHPRGFRRRKNSSAIR